MPDTWQEMTIAGRIEAINRVLDVNSESSASRIAATIPGATRNAVIGMFNRHAEKLHRVVADDVARARVARREIKRVRRAARSVTAAAVAEKEAAAKKELPAPAPVPASPARGGRALDPAGFPHAVNFLARKPGQCRRPLWGNEAKTGLVCGAPVLDGGPWCPACRAVLVVPVVSRSP